MISKSAKRLGDVHQTTCGSCSDALALRLAIRLASEARESVIHQLG